VIVSELIKVLKKLPQGAEVRICMDWLAMDEKDRPSNEQWEDDCFGVACSGKGAKNVYIINKNFS